MDNTEQAERELMEFIHKIDYDNFNKLLEELKIITNSNNRKGDIKQ